MHYRKLIILSVITAAVIAAAVYSSYQHAPETAKKTHVLFPGLKDKVNDVSEVVIKDADSTLNLVRSSGTWTIKQADGYPALFDKIKPLILNMAGLKVLAKKTKTPSLYPRLGVEDIDAKGATSHLLTLKDKAGKTQLQAKQRFVKIGEQRGSEVVVTDGLKAGERVVSAGGFKLHDGAPVKINNDVKLGGQAEAQ